MSDLLRGMSGEVRHGYEISFFLGTGAVLGCNSAETGVSRQAGSTFESLTSWIGQEGGVLDTFTMTGWDPACHTIKSRSGLPRNAYFR